MLVNGEPTSYHSPVNFALPPARYRITVEHAGFASATKEVEVVADRVVEVRIEMKRSGGILRRLPFRR